MEGIKIFRLDEIESQWVPGAAGPNEGWVKRMIYPPNVDTKDIFLAIFEINPGFSPHRWHTHTSFKSERYQVVYPEGFIEIYYIITGNGIVQWKTKDGKIEERKVGSGDSVYFPPGLPEHQLLNTGNEKIFLVACGSPTPKVTIT